MVTRILPAAVTAVVAFVFGLPLAHADIYTWTDASGLLNVSNLPPPDGIEASKIVHDSPPRPAPLANPAIDAAHQAEVQMLADRVQQLEHEVALSRNQMAPVLTYPPPMAPPPAMQYVADYGPSQNTGCDPTWADCSAGWSPAIYPTAYPTFYPATVFVVRVPNFRRNYNPIHGGHPMPMPRPPARPGAMRTR